MRADLRYRFVDFARFHIGITELGGDNKGEIIESFQKCVDGVAVGEPWCMAFTQYCLAKVFLVHGGSTKLFSSEHCLTVWNKSPPFLRITLPKVGSLVLWQHGTSSSGHVGIVTELNADGSFKTVEGNTSNGSGIVREGDGVYIRTRTTNAVGNMKFLGFLDPFYE